MFFYRDSPERNLCLVQELGAIQWLGIPSTDLLSQGQRCLRRWGHREGKIPKGPLRPSQSCALWLRRTRSKAGDPKKLCRPAESKLLGFIGYLQWKFSTN